MRQVVLHRGEDGYWVAEVSSLPGCISQGRMKEEGLSNVKEAIEQWVDAAEQLGREVPPEPFDTHVCMV